MDTTELVSRIMRAKCEQLCPECGAKMTESDRVIENGIIFVWYRCSKNDCSGQWLQKTPQQSAKFNVAVGLAYAR
jgi:hypothetical protein